jgi:undecaprenyl diphosphate synthase
MDGNGRWAQGQGRARSLGHEEGSKAVRTIVRESRRLGISALTLYAFSEQNWQRPDHEVAALMALLRNYLLEERSELMDNDIRLRAVGRRHKLPDSVREVLEPLERDTAYLDKMTLTLAISYGGREEIVDAARALAAEAKAGRLDPESIDEAMLGAAMPSTDVGPVDLLIRTGGEQRISNFLIWGSAYAELVFTDTLWPDMTEADLHAAIATYQSRERRFGLVPAPVVTPVTP